MNTIIRRATLCLTVLAVILAMASVSAGRGEGFVHGATDPVFRTKPGTALNYRSVTVTRGETFSLELKGKRNKAKAKSARKGIVSLRKTGKGRWEITCLKPGTTTLKVTRKGKIARCKVKVLPYRIGKNSTLFISHRGYAEKYPENTKIALQKAVQAGFRGSAIDIVPTKPDEAGRFDFAVSHDDTLEKMTSQKGFVRQTLARDIRKLKVTKGHNAKKYKQRMMLLDEAVDVIRQKNGIGQIEMKDAWTAAQTDRLAQKLKAKDVPDTWQIESADLISLRRFDRSQRKVGLDLQLNLIVQKAMDPMERIDAAAEYDIDNIHIYCKNVRKDVVAYSREKGVGIGAYIKMGADANEEAKAMERYRLDWLCVSDIPWSE